MVASEGIGHFLEGWYDTEFAERFGQARRTHASDFPTMLKLRLILGQYLSETHLNHYHAKAQNTRVRLRQQYDHALADVDVLALPTAPRTAFKKQDDLTRLENIERLHGTIRNTAPFNITGHPAISVPCGTIGDLPVGIMFVGERLADDELLEVAHSFEQTVGETVEC
jgi:amidase